MRKTTEEPLKKELGNLFRRYLDSPFPPGNPDRSLDRIHDELVLYTDYVASAIIELLKGPRPLFRLRHYNGLHENKGLERQISKVITKAEDPSLLEAARYYSEYYEQIKKMVRAAREYLKVRKLERES